MVQVKENLWLILEAEDQHFIVFTYMDREAGLSGKGGAVTIPPNADELSILVSTPSITIRFDPQADYPASILSENQIKEYDLPQSPKWFEEFFFFDPVWQRDENLQDRFLPDYPNDLQVVVHEGSSRLSSNTPELIWARVIDVDEKSYHAIALNQPHKLQSISAGSRFRFIMTPNAKYPFMVSEKYLEERKNWKIIPCEQCGLEELFDAPSDLIPAIFPDLPTDGFLSKFTTFCPMCRGVQLVQNLKEQ